MIFFVVADLILEEIVTFSRYARAHEFVYSKKDNYTKDYYRFTEWKIYTNEFGSRTESMLDLSFLMFPTVVVLYMLVPSLGFLYAAEEITSEQDPLFSVFIIGHQWYWSYEYHFSDLLIQYINYAIETANILDIKIVFDSILDTSSRVNRLLSVDNHLLLPTNVEIFLYTSSTDVIHSWALPQYGIKIDAIPGRLSLIAVNSFANGTYFGQCSELCGVNHGFMPIAVEFLYFKQFAKYIYCAVYGV